MTIFLYILLGIMYCSGMTGAICFGPWLSVFLSDELGEPDEIEIPFFKIGSIATMVFCAVSLLFLLLDPWNGLVDRIILAVVVALIAFVDIWTYNHYNNKQS